MLLISLSTGAIYALMAAKNFWEVILLEVLQVAWKKKLSLKEAKLLKAINKWTVEIEKLGWISACEKRAECYKELGRYEEALADYSKIIEFDPSADNYWKRSELYAAMNRNKEALVDLTKAIELVPKNPENCWRYMKRGHFYFKLRKYSKALADYIETLEIAPDFILPGCPSCFENILDEYRLAFYTKVIRDEPSAWNYNHRGELYFKQKQYARALADYKRVIEIKPDYIDKKIEPFEESLNAQRIAVYTKLIEQEPTESNYELRGDIYFAMGKYAQAVDDYSKAMEIYWRGDFICKRARAYYELKRYDEAIRDYREALSTMGESGIADRYFGCGRACYDAERYAEAAQCFSEVLKRYPNHWSTRYNRGAAYFYSGQYAAAKADFDTCINAEPEDILDCYYMRGLCHRALGDNSKAQADFARQELNGRRLF